MAWTSDAPTRETSLQAIKRNAETITVGATRALKRAAIDQTSPFPRIEAAADKREEDAHDGEDSSSSDDSSNEPESQQFECVTNRKRLSVVRRSDKSQKGRAPSMDMVQDNS